jgi:Peptidase family S41
MNSQKFSSRAYLVSRQIQFSVLALVAFLVGCGTKPQDDSNTQLVSLSKAEALADFKQIVDSMKGQYGPLEYKEARFGFKFPDLVSKYKQEIEASNTDAEFFASYSRFLGEFHDGHVSFRAPVASTVGMVRAFVPIEITPVQGRAIVEAIDEDVLKGIGVEAGDELLLVDGRTPFEIAASANKYKRFGNELSDKLGVGYSFVRGNFMGELVPKSSTVVAVFQKPDGTKTTQELSWRFENEFSETIRKKGKTTNFVMEFDGAKDFGVGNIKSWGKAKPRFATSEVIEKFQFAPVSPTADSLKKFEVDSQKAPEVYASLYKHQGKSILLVRQPSYSMDDIEGLDTDQTIQTYLGTYKAILSQYQPLADVLVIDQTRNPGGYLDYCLGMSRLFAQSEGAGFVQAFNADRKWVNEFETWARWIDTDLKSEEALKFLNVGKQIEAALNANQSLTKPIAFFGDSVLRPDAQFVWKRPLMVLVDEQAGSCGDIFPMMVQRNNLGKIFGTNTMGLGGNVESMKLNHSQATIRLTRGLFTTSNTEAGYAQNPRFAENTGVKADVQYTHTVEDVRAGLVDYVTQFSSEAVKMVK